MFDRIPVQRMSPRPHTLRPRGHKGNSYRASVFPQVAARALRNQGPVSVGGPINHVETECCPINMQTAVRFFFFMFCFHASLGLGADLYLSFCMTPEKLKLIILVYSVNLIMCSSLLYRAVVLKLGGQATSGGHRTVTGGLHNSGKNVNLPCR